MVASKEDIQAALSGSPIEPEPAAPAGIGAPDDEPLELPSTPPASKPESEFETKLAGRDVIEIPPLSDAAPPEPPKFNEPSAPPPSFGATSPEPESSGSRDYPTTPPIPSPFSGGGSKPPSFEEPVVEAAPVDFSEDKTQFHPESFPTPEAAPASPFAEPEPSRPEPAMNPFNQESAPQENAMAQSQWTPPSSPSGQSSGPGGSFNPPAAGGQKVNQTLPIVSLVFGILSICCYISPITGIVALVTGFLGMKNAKNDPAHYGGKTLAIVGMILGAVFFVIAIAYWVFMLFLGGANILMQMANQAR
jgi:hypothetical protein